MIDGVSPSGPSMSALARKASLGPHSQQLGIVAIVVVAAMLFWVTSKSLVLEWLDTDKRIYTHGPLVVLIGLWLLWRGNTPSLQSRDVPTQNYPWLLALVVTSMVWLIATRAAIQAAHQALIPVLIWLAVRATFGPATARRSLVPIAFFYCAIPIWDAAVPLLQSMTVQAVAAGLKALSIPAFVTGNLVHIPAGTFEVEDGCSGLHYFIVALTLAVLLGELQGDSPRSRIALVVIALALAIVSNWLRVLVVAIAGHLTDMQHFLVRVDHYYFGWALFAVAITVFFGLARLIAPTTAGAITPKQPAVRDSPNMLVSLVTALLALAVGPAYAAALPLTAAEHPNVRLPPAAGAWTRAATCPQQWTPHYPAADTNSEAGYASRDGRVCVYAASYLSQHQGKELVGYGNAIVGVDVPAETVRRVYVHGMPFQELVTVLPDSQRAVVWYHYIVGHRRTTSPLIAQLEYAWQSLWSRTPASVLAVAATCQQPSCTDATQLLDRFIEEAAVATQFRSTGAVVP